MNSRDGHFRSDLNSRDGPFRSDFGTLGTLLQVSDIRLTIDEKQKEKSRCQKLDIRRQIADARK